MKRYAKKSYPDHTKKITRLNKIKGQIEGVTRMIEEKRYCPEILNQLRAVRSAVKSLEGQILQSHLQSCVTDAFKSNNESEREIKIKELTNLFLKSD